MHRIHRLIAPLAVIAVVLAACGSGGSSGGAGENTGVIKVFGAFRSPESDRFAEAIKAFEDSSGVDVQYEGSSDFATLINTRVEAGDPPDIAAFPQPGLLYRFADQGKLVALRDDVVANIDANYGPGWKDLGSRDGTPYGVFHRVNAKGFVYYPKGPWEAAGYQVPETWDDLQALMDQMVADGTPPWCITIEDGDATGWVGTDWIEEIILRTGGVDKYDQWVNHDITFEDPLVKDAWQRMGDIWLNPDYVYGGTTQILSTRFQDGANPMFDNPPKCWMHNQGSFMTGLFPDSVQANLDSTVGVFTLPAIDSSIGTPAEVGGDAFAAFADRPEVMDFLKYLTTPQSAETWMKAGGALFPYTNQDFSLYSSDIERSFAMIIANASQARFDGSDSMPAAVGNGSFWKGVVDYVSGTDLDSVLKSIDDSWPSS
jgi:alpha-glucoside transport system substrate-binding protein